MELCGLSLPGTVHSPFPHSKMSFKMLLFPAPFFRPHLHSGTEGNVMAERRNVMAERKGMVERRNAGRECHDRAKIMSHQQRHGRAERNVKAIGKRPRRNGRNMNVVEGTEGTEIGNGTGRAIGKGGTGRRWT